MTEQLFQTDSYIKEFAARIVGVDEGQQAVILDRTAFYPMGGGQPDDQGILQTGGKSYQVVKVRKAGPDILHYIEGTLPSAGQQVTGKIDWERRYALMRIHTALHILCGVIWRDYQAQVTGGNMEPLKGRLDFELEFLSTDLIRDIEEKINQEVQNAREVKIRILPREEAFKIPDLIRTKINLLPESLKEIRTVEVVGLDFQADGGTHVAKTREVGQITIADYKSKGRINKRIEISLTESALSE